MPKENKKHKILFLSHDSGLYGAQMSLYLILKSLDREKYEAIVNIHKEGPLLDKVKELGWQVVQLPRIRLCKHQRPHLWGLGERLTWPFWEKIRGERFVRLIQNENIDLVYTNTMVCFEGAYAAFRTQRPHLWHLREILPRNQKLFGVFGLQKTLAIISRYATKVICVSDAVKYQFKDWEKTPDHYVTIYNGIDPESFNPDKVEPLETSLREQFQISENIPLIAYTARISPQKGFEELIEACILLKQENIKFHVIIIGESIDTVFFNCMTNRITEMGLTPQLHFIGKQPSEKMAGYLKQMDIFATPSHDEPFARSILEAMAMKLPVVGTDTGGIPEAVLHGETGLIAKTEDAASFANALKTLILDPQLRKTYGENGRKRVIEHFSIERYINSVHQLLAETLQETANF